MSNMTRKEFLKLTGTAAGAGLMATSGFGSVARAQSSELLHRKIPATFEMAPAVGLGTDCWVRPTEVTEGDLPATEQDKKLADQFKYREELPPQQGDDD